MKPQITTVLTALIVMPLCSALAQGKQALAREKDVALLQGEWSMISGSADGQPMPEAMVETGKRVCKADVTTVTVGGQLIMKARFTLDPSKTPKTIDYEAIEGPTKGKSHLGIYQIDGEMVKFCFGAPGEPRPTDFTSKEGDKRTLSVWKRNKAAAATQPKAN